MMRSLLVLSCVFCVATLISEVLWIGMLWYRGQLDGATIQEIRNVLSGRNEETSTADTKDDAFAASSEEIDQVRAMRILELSNRENELGILKGLVDQKAQELLNQQQRLETLKKDFEAQLAQIKASNSFEATEQSRAVLLKMEPTEAVDYLMQLDLPDNIRLLKGMAEKDIAAVLQAFTGKPEKVERGRKIFEAISRGEPEKELVQTTAAKTTPPETAP